MLVSDAEQGPVGKVFLRLVYSLSWPLFPVVILHSLVWNPLMGIRGGCLLPCPARVFSAINETEFIVYLVALKGSLPVLVAGPMIA